MLTRRDLLGRGILISAAGFGVTSASPALAAPESKLIDRHWRGSGADAGPDHSVWTAFLGAWRRLGADGVARFDYAGARGAADQVGAYVAMLSRAEPTRMTRPAAFAYWANLYNATTVMLVLDAYPVDSIKEVRGGFFNLGPWTDEVVTVEGRRLSLDDIEHGVMRPVWSDPRIHYAVNCAAIGCPNLAGRAWEAATLEADLDRAARAFVNHPRGAQLQDAELTVSSIYHWFKEDFGGDDRGVIRHLRRYAEPPLLAALEGVAEIEDHDYDWSLNDV